MKGLGIQNQGFQQKSEQQLPPIRAETMPLHIFRGFRLLFVFHCILKCFLENLHLMQEDEKAAHYQKTKFDRNPEENTRKNPRG